MQAIEQPLVSPKIQATVNQNGIPVQTASNSKSMWLKDNMHNEKELLKFLDDPTNNLEDQPTDLLVNLA